MRGHSTLTRALQRRNDLVPQMSEYDKLGVTWHPYIMYFQSPHFASKVVSTDSFGFRLTPFGHSSISPMQYGDIPSCSLLVGASTAFGVGAETDKETIAAHLSSAMGVPWLNMGGRAFSAFQEYSLTASVVTTLPRVETIVLVSGFNNLFLAQRALPFDLPLGSFFYQHEFIRAMQNQHRGRKARLSALVRRTSDLSLDDHRSVDDAIQLAAKSTHQSLTLWSALAKFLGARLLFALQPTSMWAERVPSAQETELFSLLSEIDPGLTLTLTRLDQSCYQKYRNQLEQASQLLGIDFLDLNDAIRASALAPTWHYVDRVHYTGAGYKMIADAIQRLL